MSILKLNVVAVPSTPAAGKVRVFAGTDKIVKQIDDAGLISILGRRATTMPAAVPTSGTGETLLFKALIPAGAQIGDTFRVTLFGVSSSTGTLLFRARVGANGSIADNQAWISTTSAAQVANAWAEVDVLITLRSAIAVQASGCALAGAVVLPQLIGAPATAAIVSTSQWYIDITCACSVGTFTAQNAAVEAM